MVSRFLTKIEGFMNNLSDFTVGCNYWASNAGLYMWRNWDESVVEKDLVALKESGIDTLRVFPLWSDFQPLTCNCGQKRAEMRIYDRPLDKSPEGIAGVDPVMVQRFERLVVLAQKYGFKLLVCIINGWMSGKIFVPTAFNNINPIIDRTAIKWQIRFVKYMVNRFRQFDNIVAWEAGNESNVMGWIGETKTKKDDYWVWLSGIVNAIKSVDPERPVIAGMHGLEMQGELSPSDVGEICDVMTVHPYAAFVPHCFTDTIDSMKTRLHSVAEATLYSDIGGKPCLCEEIGTLGYMLGWEDRTAEFIKVNANSLWANGSTGIVWWCSHDQTDFSFAPYDWNGLERELGFIRKDGSFKPVKDVFVNLKEFLSENKPLPERNRHAVCILTQDQDNWAVAYSSFILSKQAGFDVRFADGDYEIPQSDVYMLPSLCGEAMPLRTWRELLSRVYNDGAVLYMSYNSAFISEFAQVTGVKVVGNKEGVTSSITIPQINETMELFAERKLLLTPVGAEVLATDNDSNPVLTVNNYGKGKVYFLNFAPELHLADSADAFNKNYYKLYEYIFKNHTNTVIESKSSPFIGLTEHENTDGTVTVTAINYSNETIDFNLKISKDYNVISTSEENMQIKGEVLYSSLAAGEMCIIGLNK